MKKEQTMKMNGRAVIIFSGGMDSATLLYKLISDGYEVYALSLNYNQRHKRELNCAKKLCGHLNVNHKIIDISSINELLQGSALTSSNIEVPEGHYEDESMKLTVVPNRNMIMLSLAVGYAVSLKAGKVFFGAHAGDHEIYPDCRKEFVEKLNTVTKIANYEPVEVLAPFVDLSKGDIAKLGKELGVRYDLTHTCYKNEYPPCGKCGCCVERAEAFEFAGVKDPLV